MPSNPGCLELYGEMRRTAIENLTGDEMHYSSSAVRDACGDFRAFLINRFEKSPNGTLIQSLKTTRLKESL